MSKRTKRIYRDLSTGRLITPQEAQNRDPTTYIQERFEHPESIRAMRRDPDNREAGHRQDN